MTKITINVSEYDELCDRSALLRALELGGVDNWEWYDESLTEYREEKERDEKLEDLKDEMLEMLSQDTEEPAGRGCGYAVGSSPVTQIEVVKMFRRAHEILNGVN